MCVYVSFIFATFRICGNKSVSFNFTKLMICDLSKTGHVIKYCIEPQRLPVAIHI